MSNIIRSDATNITITNGGAGTAPTMAVGIQQTGTCKDITATVSGGTAPYTYKWNTGASTANLTATLPGIYTVLVTDSTGATGTATWTVTEHCDCPDDNSPIITETKC